MKLKELHLISNGKMPLRQFVQLVSKVHPYVTAIHFREKSRSAREVWDAIEQLNALKVPLRKVYINDRVDVAYAAKVRGVQLAFHSLEPSIIKSCFSNLRIGKSVHSVVEAQEAESQGADYLLFGHVFPSESKPGVPARGVESLGSITAAVQIPVVAIGGILPLHLSEISSVGAAGVAVISGILEAKDPVLAVKQYWQGITGGEKHEEI
jgi:thiazole tautomerase (transcriptional regulator TenI)